jgi:hypothetical protein
MVIWGPGKTLLSDITTILIYAKTQFPVPQTAVKRLEMNMSIAYQPAMLKLRILKPLSDAWKGWSRGAFVSSWLLSRGIT